MRFKIVAAVTTGLLVGIIASPMWQQADAQVQDRAGRQRVEYKVVFSPIEHFELQESRMVEGKLKEIDHGPRASA